MKAKRMNYSLIALATLPFAVSAATPSLQQHDHTPKTQRYLVKFKHELSPVESPLVSGEQRIYNLHGTAKRLMHKQNTLAAELSSAAVKQLQSDPVIALIEVDPVRELAHKGYSSYGVPMVQAPLVADTQSSNQKVCVIDTGYDSRHEDLPNGANITGEVLDATGGERTLGDWFEDTYGHGTHITGTLAALGNNIGLQGILPSGSLNIHHVKVVDNAGYWRVYGSDVIAAMNACESAGATVVNMSLAGWQHSQIEQDAMQSAYDNGLLLVAAGGNLGTAKYVYPASYDAVVSVGAIDKHQDAWMFTQQNDQIELVAPGVEVNSTLPKNKYGKWDGTSVAAPHVSGVAALVWSHFPSCSNARIREALAETALDLGETGRDNLYGNGLVQAKAAVDWLASNGCAEAKTCREIKDSNPTAASGMYRLDFDGSGPLSTINVYCDMHTLGGGWTQYAYHKDGTGPHEALDTMDGKTLGVLSDGHWRFLIENMRDGMMFIDENKVMSHISKQKLLSGNCVSPLSIQSLRGSKNLKLWHSENSGCNGTGRDYSLVVLSGKGGRSANIAGASVYQQSSVKFDIWNYASNWSYGFQNELHYFIR